MVADYSFSYLMRRFPVLLIILLAGPGMRESNAASAPDFNRDIRPILSDKCFRCHGPDENERKGGLNGLRLDSVQGAREDLGGGAFAIVPGKPEKSELMARVTSTDEEEVMPPPETHKILRPSDIAMLEQWVREGAIYEDHWAFVPPQRPVEPVNAARADWARNAIDRFVLARLEKEDLTPSPEADRRTLIRRTSGMTSRNRLGPEHAR